ncbi:MAG TPA: mechanosensitive ion channel family protein [Bryobacteraceae bacterium]|nr:mechanosensitive ion channel family protein [Bryobacteraceae bacterium]
MEQRLNTARDLFLNHPMALIVPLIVFLVTILVGYVVRRLLMRALRAWTTRTQSRPGLILSQALPGPILIWVLILAVHLAMQSSAAPSSVTFWGARLLLVLWIISLTMLSRRIVRDMVRLYGSQVSGALPVATLTQNLAQLAVVILGCLFLLRAFGVEITPLLTALGVGGLAVALALQDTLSNLFAGFYISVAGQVRLGDYIKTNSGEEGYVADISWRSTTIRSLGGNMIIIPNAKLAQAIVTNYDLPEKRMSASVSIGVDYDRDVDRVERILLEVAQQAAREIPEMLADPAPSVAFDPGFGDSALQFTVNFQVTEFVKQFGVRNELRKRIFRRLRAEGIGIPFPTRTVYLETPQKPGTPAAEG